MKIKHLIIFLLTLLLINSHSFSQDIRTTGTKVADILASFPAYDKEATDKIMNDILNLGEQGIKLICDKIIPAGTGDDTAARFAIESLSRYLSGKGKEKERIMWEKICIEYALNRKDTGIKDFFMKQLQLIGGEQSVTALKDWLADAELCEPALAVITSAGGKSAESVLTGSLKNKELPCAASVLNALALMNSSLAVNDYLYWLANGNSDIKASALNALACSGDPAAYVPLSEAAKSASYKWEPTGATASLIKYAMITGRKGDIKTADKISRLLISKCTDKQSVQYRIDALHTYMSFHGQDAMSLIFQATSDMNAQYMNAAVSMTLELEGNDITRRWISYFPRAAASARPAIIRMLGLRGDDSALPLVTGSLADKDMNVRTEAAAALVLLSGGEYVNSLIDYMLMFSDQTDQEAAKRAFMTAAGSDKMYLLLPVLKDGPAAARVSAIEILSWNKATQYFSDVLPFTASGDTGVKAAAFKSLVNLATPGDQDKLIELLSVTDDENYVADLQRAIAAAGNAGDPEKASVKVLQAMSGAKEKEKLIPVLAMTGGAEALKVVLAEFENGGPETRDICFKTLMNWKDYTASSALYTICASGNKTFEAPAFDGYIRQVSSSTLPDDQKLLLFRKIMPFALSSDRKKKILEETGDLETYQSLFFVSKYLDDPDVSAVAARSAASIALPSGGSAKGMYGLLAGDILRKAASLLRGPESDYEREMINKYLSDMPAGEGFVSMFNGKYLSGWKGLVGNPVTRASMGPAELTKKQAEADKKALVNWSVRDGCIWFTGNGDNLCSDKEYGDFELLADWKITKDGDSGIYLRGTPQVQIWDTSRKDAGAGVGSGGLYNNQKNPSIPLKVADNPVGDWNSFRILMRGERVWVWLNGQIVVDSVILENFWDRSMPIFPKGQVELQAHGTDLAFRDIYIREISQGGYTLTDEEKKEGFVVLFNGQNLDNWVGNKVSYVAENGNLVVKPEGGSGGNLYTEKEYSDFIFRFEFQLTPGANNGLGIRAPLDGDAAYKGMEIQILDDPAPVYANIETYQHHGSVYGVIPAKQGYLKPVGEWNSEEVTVKGTKIKVILNGTTIVDGDIAGPRDNGTMDHKDHPGLKNTKGHIGFLGHGSELKFRNIRIKDLSR